jgi:hypothetical protein
MRSAEFNVHPEIIIEFVDELVSRNVNNSIIGTTDDGEVIIKVDYEKNENAEIDELEEILDNLSAQLEDDEEDED